MKITYINHATLLIETNGVRILTDPWIFGPAYCEQWYQFPVAPANVDELIQNIDYILLTHGHEDHLHYETLTYLNPSAHVYYPYSWYEGSAHFFKDLGFLKFTEALNEKTYTLAPGLKLTYIANNLDNMFILENDKQVLANINDALHSAPKSLIHYFTHKIKTRWPKIDYLWCGYGGASYYPNMVKAPGKNDMEVGIIREQLFVDNFCTIAQQLNATYSIPFACDFVLIGKEQQWINETRFARHQIPSYFQTHFANKDIVTQIKILYAGDSIDQNKFTIVSPFHHQIQQGRINELVAQVYSKEIDQKSNTPIISHEDFLSLCQKLEHHIQQKHYIVPVSKKSSLKFSIQITDASGEGYVHINLETSPDQWVTCKNDVSPDDVLLLKVSSKSLLYSISQEWGGDALIIGYGCEVILHTKETIEEEFDNYAIQLLTHYPNTKEYIKKNPIRALRYLLRDDLKRKAFVKKIFGQKTEDNYSDPLLKDNQVWLTRSSCEICKKCNLPIIDEKLANQL